MANAAVNAWRRETPGIEAWGRSARPGDPHKHYMVSADCHAVEPGGYLAERIEPEYRDRLPRIEVREEPDPSGEFDVWFLDNEFEGRKLAPELTVEVREKNPDALIFACSATLDASCLKELLNAGADGACDKSLPEDLISAMGVIRAYAAELPARRAGGRGRPRGGVLGAIESIRGLLREWNSRLDREETASQEHAR